MDNKSKFETLNPEYKDMSEALSKIYCTTCYAGQTFYPTAILRKNDRSGNLLICNCCGTIYLKTKDGTLVPEKLEMVRYQQLVERKLNEYKQETSEVELRPIIVPLMWSFFQDSWNYLKTMNKTIITTDIPFFLSFGLHNLAMALGTRVSLGMLEINKNHQQVMQTLQSEGKRGLFTMIYVTDVFDPERVKTLNQVELTVICIKDSRENTEISNPKVFSIL